MCIVSVLLSSSTIFFFLQIHNLPRPTIPTSIHVASDTPRLNSNPKLNSRHPNNGAAPRQSPSLTPPQLRVAAPKD
ncbi:uncharacterized protein M6B38_130685 [Iris pallida]|uniref:Uncharacterized protein n=1 Tax=Iris pallida TaxID=29817 RepID=A0AAX6FZQ9_IRIPA|nr:uncharacterized protein M6B38_130685 [Iris pallida]